MHEDVPLHIIHLDQDDPKKCTARKLASRNLATLHFSTRRPPRRGYLLDPSAGIILGPDDIPLINRGAALVALDCSWKRLEESLDVISKISPRLEGRTLPLVLAANPVSWGRPGRLHLRARRIPPTHVPNGDVMVYRQHRKTVGGSRSLCRCWCRSLPKCPRDPGGRVPLRPPHWRPLMVGGS